MEGQVATKFIKHFYSGNTFSFNETNGRGQSPKSAGTHGNREATKKKAN